MRPSCDGSRAASLCRSSVGLAGSGNGLPLLLLCPTSRPARGSHASLSLSLSLSSALGDLRPLTNFIHAPLSRQHIVLVTPDGVQPTPPASVASPARRPRPPLQPTRFPLCPADPASHPKMAALTPTPGESIASLLLLEQVRLVSLSPCPTLARFQSRADLPLLPLSPALASGFPRS